MPNEYLDLLESGQTANDETGGNPYLDLIEEERAIPAGVVRAVADSNPDDVARQKRIASSLGVPLAAVEADPLFATNEVKARQIEAAPPVVRQKFTDADFARLAHDNVDSLSAIEQAFAALKDTGRAAVSGLRSGSAGAVGLARMPFDLGAAALDPLVGTILPENPLARGAQWLQEYQQGIASRAKAEMPKGDDNLSAGYYSGIASLTRNLAALPMAFLPGGQKAALGAMVAPVGGEAYGQGRDAGKSIASSLSFASSQAAIEYATEKLPLTKLLGDLKQGTPFFKTMLHNAALEVPGEQLATALQDLNEWAVLPENKDKPFADYIAERPDAAVQTLVATLVGTGGQVTVMEGVSKAVGYAEKRSTKAQQAEQQTAFLDNLNNLAASDKLLQRDADTFESFVAAAAEDGPVDTVYVDGRMLMQSGMAPRLAEMSPAVRDQIDRAILTGGDIAIPVSEYAARIAPTDLAPQLLDHLKTDAEGFSRAEAADFMANQGAELQAEVERILSDQQDADTFRASQDVVKQDILGQLNTAGRFTPQVNEAYATLASAYSAVRAAQLGMTPEAFHAERGMRVQGAAVAGQQFSQADESAIAYVERTTGSTAETEQPDDPDLGRSVILRGKGADVQLSVREDDTGVYLNNIQAKQKGDLSAKAIGTGEGTAAINALREYADKTGKPLFIVDATEKGAEYWSRLDWLKPESVTVPLDGKDYTPARSFAYRPQRQSAPLQTDTPAFKAWFGDSKVVDAEGEPLVVYHGTGVNVSNTGEFISGDFTTFDPALSGKSSKTGAPAGTFFFTDDPEVASSYTVQWRGDFSEKYKDGANVVPVYMALKKPLIVNAKEENWREILYKGEYRDINEIAEIAQTAGKYDGVIVKRVLDHGVGKTSGKPSTTYVAFHPEQIKSAIGNNGDFDPKNPDILNQSASQDGAVTLRALADEGNNQAIVAQALVYRAGFSPKQFADVLEGVSIGAQPDGLVGVPAFAAMLSHMRAAVLDDAKVLDAVVGSIPVDVVNNLFGSESAAKVALHDEAMNQDSPAFNTDLMVSGGLGDTSNPVGLLVREVAVEAAKVARSAFNNRLESSKDGAAALAGDGNSFSQSARLPRAAFHPSTNTISLLDNADLSSFLHESAHYFFENDIGLASELVGKESLTAGEQQIIDDVSRLLTWHGIQGDVTEQLRQWHTMDFEEQRSHHERTAESFEAYLFSGQAPNLELQPIFQRFRAWMVNVYKSIKDFLAKNPEAGKLNDEVRSVFDRMIATQEQIALAEQARSLTALFASPETSGMTPEAFAAYQALGVDATNTAIEELQAKGLRDMQWLANARGRAVKKLQKESKAVRAEVTMDARREVMSQPLYRAWDFLTRKLTDNDKLPPLERKSSPDVLDPTLDSLFVAIAKLGGIKKDQVISEWGVDPKDAPQSGLFGKPVWRVTEGLPIDSMAAVLAEHGYLPLNEHGQYELNDLGDRFLEELAGNTQYSHAYQPQDNLPGEQIANPAGLMAGRFDRAGLASIGIPDEIAGHLQALKMTANEGLHPDLVAELFGFSSGDELARMLAAAPTPKDAINSLAEQMMLERFGELATPDAIERAADQAIHNDVRARMLTTEVNALAQAIGKPKILASAAKAFAADMIARLKVRDVRPGQYANAEAKASKAAEKAHKAGDTALAAAEKRNQIIQHYATRAAYDAQDEVQSGLRYLRKFDKRSKTIDPEYQDQIEAMLERFELRAISNKAVDRRTSLAQWLTAQREAGLEPDIDPQLENEAFRTSYKNITVEEFRGLVDAVKQIEHLGRLKNKLLTAQDQRAFKAIVEEVAGSIVDNGGAARNVELEGPSPTRTLVEGIFAGHRKLASLIRQMDGGKDNGPFWRVFVRGMNEASTAETVMNEQATVALAAIYQPVLDLKGDINGDKQFIPEIGDSLTRAGRLSVALNWGNATNRQRVMQGDGWSEYQVQAILSRLSKTELEFVNNVWAYIDTYWPQIEAKEKRVTGRAPEKVPADPFTLMVDGEAVAMRGGYYPLKYDSNRADRAGKNEAAQIADEMKRGALVRSTTARGHTVQRVENVGMPVRKSLDVITQHVGQVTHDLAWHEWLIDANRLLGNDDIATAIRDHYGKPVLDTMRDALTGIAVGNLQAGTTMDKVLLHLRANVSRSTMGLSLTTAFLQPFGLAQSMVRIGPTHVMRGAARWAGDATRFESSMTWIGEKSDFMRLRSKTFNRELHEIKGRVSHGHSKARQIYEASLFMLMQKMQMVADVPTWIGAYEKAIVDNDEQTAVALADQAVLDAQGGGQTKDMSEFQRNHPFMTMFYSYFNTTLNLAAESTAATDFKNPLAVAGWASDMALLMVIPALAPAMLLAFMKGGGCDDVEDCAAKMAEAEVGYLLGLMLGVRELSGPVAGYDYSGPPVGRVITELTRAGTQVKQGEADEAAAMSAISLLGVTLGIPSVQILRSYRGWKAWEDGDAPVTSILMGPPPKD